MKPILIVSGTEKGAEALSDLLKNEGYTLMETVNSASEARRRLSTGNYWLVIINMPLSDESGRELAFQIGETEIAPLAIVRAGNEEIFGHYGSEKSVFVLTKPLNRQSFHNALRYIRIAQVRLEILRKKNRELLKTLEDTKVINRAKCKLIENEHVGEEEAHRRIEKEAMNLRLTRRQVAEKILAKW